MANAWSGAAIALMQGCCAASQEHSVTFLSYHQTSAHVRQHAKRRKPPNTSRANVFRLTDANERGHGWPGACAGGLRLGEIVSAEASSAPLAQQASYRAGHGPPDSWESRREAFAVSAGLG